ncbi:Prolyl oligopeptidase family protein [Chitinophaga jiangningensis]|uniref:Prolyl oligopeptidase family protein n=1 Tax=Chitinophaga jiangningensis TaxID=1419482 RepID=A0A1M7CRJ0_9BACT|nr:prolyl oligopeptidase family serine peptidase [Chitinophaga jiangningensis]SHL69790.1 Prolyl oligopeptidase family protein [Chitinophaga jiangningensis]
MRKYVLGSLLMGTALMTYAQQPSKKPLDHSVYDGWETAGAKVISNDGQWIAYTINPQEGDGRLIIFDRKTGKETVVPRGGLPVITEDSKFVISTIKPPFKVVREAKIKKKKAADMPKDSLVIVTLATGQIEKIANVKSFKTPAKGSGLLAYLAEAPAADTSKAKNTKVAAKKDEDREDDDKAGADKSDNGLLVIRQLLKGTQDTIKNAGAYTIAKPGNNILVAISGNKKDSLSSTGVLLWHTASRKADTLSRGYGDYKQLTLDNKGEQAAYLATRDSAKSLQQFYSLYFYKPGADSAIVVVDKTNSAIPTKWNVSANGNLSFSENNERLFFGTAPILPPKDTTIVDFEVAKVDIWNYKDDYLQPMQLKNADKELKRTYLAVYYPGTNRAIQLADKDLETVIASDKGDGKYALGYTDKNDRIQLQWIGRSLKTAYLVNLTDGTRKKVKERLDGMYSISPKGKYILWYDLADKSWWTYNNESGATTNISSKVPVKLYDEEDDHPDLPEAYGLAGWMEQDNYVYVYDRYDVWQLDPTAAKAPVNVTNGYGRKNAVSLRFVRLDPEETAYKAGQMRIMTAFADTTKYNGYFSMQLPGGKAKLANPVQIVLGPNSYNDLSKAKNADVYSFVKASYVASPDVYVGAAIDKAVKISSTNPQQQNYNWGTAELYNWTTFSGKKAAGILYKPEDFDANKKYPVIFYFYEKLTDGLYNYQPPAPTPSRLNISFFVSRGYLVFAPDISYEPGYPGKSAYEYIVSAAEDLAKQSYVDGKHMGIQGQSWGGYQVAYLITQTNMFAAAWAGAPVANMTSAYGGIRWESGMNRQFQYEHSQSRIGATLWEKPELYLQNSPLFSLPKVTTPLAIMANDADGAVPWYQGIELFTGLRRLGKPVWMLNYNNEAHNLVQRQNRKDISRREQQFFDHLLKGAAAPEWMEYGVPATQKGVNWGFDLVK